MAWPSVSCHLPKLRDNVEHLAQRLHAHGAQFAAVTKGVCAAEPIIKMLEASSCDALADARVQNLARMPGGKPRLLIRSAQAAEVGEVLRWSELSYESEPSTLALLGREAARRGERHGVLLALDMGDLREGVFFRDRREILRLAQAAAAEPWLELMGVGTNLGCFGGVKTTPENMGELVDIARWLRRELDRPLPLVSGMTTAAQSMLFAGTMPREVNHGRYGEAWLVGHDSVSGEAVPGMHRDAFVLTAQLLEVKTKPSKPVGEIGGDAFGHVVERPDRGLMCRGLLAVGVQDTDRDCLEPLDEGVEILGGSSDHTIVKLSGERNWKPGDLLRFRMAYGAVLRAYTSAYVEKEYIEE